MSSSEHQLVVLGSGGVGKSALTVQFVHFHFLESYDPTIEDAYRRQVVVDEEPAVLSILDTAGQEEYSAMRGQYMSQGKGFLLCYAITNRDTFDEVKALHEQVLMAKDSDYVPIVIVGTKCDLEHQRKVSQVEAKTLADKWGCAWLETSAKARINVEEAFFSVVREIRKEASRKNAENNSSSSGEKKKKIISSLKPKNPFGNVVKCVIC
eukprot:TRINITY_DN476_c0_g1_i3.p1 TRINITY_DN476_c0_g1~~TRINITY_DN476_c0_g1_i3.p1  ORF type:complete len:209 (+),score=49.07 TRINITY_DN476_c0_g1_i3:371-997(+)